MAGLVMAQGTGSGGSTVHPARPSPGAPPIPVAPTRPGEGTGAVAVPGGGAGIPAAPTAQDEVGTQTVIVQPPPYRDVRGGNEIPPEVIPIIGMVMGTGIAIALGYPIIRTITRMIERASDKRYVRGQDVEVQLRALQESVDTMAIEIERISESQRYQSKLLSERKQDALGPG